MVDSKGTPKGMQHVLMVQEQGVDEFKAKDMRTVLKEMHDFE